MSDSIQEEMVKVTDNYIDSEMLHSNSPYRVFGIPCNWYVASMAVFLASVLFWWRALFQGKLIIHGETVHFDLPMMAVQSNMLHGDPGILWSDLLCGGFPLFAEGQAAFANPIKLALALTLDPVSALMACHFSATLLGGIGILLLARAIGLTPLAGLFAAFAGGFSMEWIFVHDILVWAGTLTMAPWVLLGVEHWLRHSNLKSVLLLAAGAAMMVLSGYPMFTHGVALYASVRVAAELLRADGRRMLRINAMRLFGSGVAATVLGLGLCAIQIIPLLELVPLSYRSDGIKLIYPGSLMLTIKGLLFSYIGSASFDQALNFPIIGSALVSILFFTGLFLCKDRRLFAHAIAAIFMVNLGMQEASPLFRFVYEHRLIPGLHSFRAMMPYFGIAVIGIALFAGGALDALSQDIQLRRTAKQRWPWAAGVILLAIAVIVLAIGKLVYVHEYGARQFLAAIVIAPIYLLLIWQRKQRLLLPIALCLLAAECFWIRFGVFHLSERSVLTEPLQARAIKAELDLSRSWRTVDLTTASGFGFMPPNDPQLEAGIGSMIGSLTPMANLLWQIPSIEAATSLGLRRWLIVFNIFPDEFLERQGTPGSRFIDILGVRYATLPSGQSLQHAQELFHEEGKWSVYKNAYAQPRFQFYSRARAFRSLDDVLKSWPTRRSDELFIESSEDAPGWIASDAELRVASWEVSNMSATATTLKVKAASPVWLFMADADYPGWNVYVNGNLTPHYAAQILGKAVALPAGENIVEFKFKPKSFYVGSFLSLASLLIAVGLLMRVLVSKMSLLSSPPKEQIDANANQQ